MTEARPFESLFSGVPKEWFAVAQSPIGTALKLGPGHWLCHVLADSIEEARLYGAMLDFVTGNAKGEKLRIHCSVYSNWKYVEADRGRPAEMAADLCTLTEAKIAALSAEVTAPGAVIGSWRDWGPCEKCREKKNYIRIFADDNLYRCTHCGRWAEYIEESDFDQRRHRSGLDWEKALPIIDGKHWMSPTGPERATDIIRARILGEDVPWISDRKARQELSERRFELPARIPAGDVVPLAKQLFEKLELPFNPLENIDAEQTHTLKDPSGRKVVWADYAEEGDGFLGAMGGGAFNVQARIEMPPHFIGFEIFASRLVAFTISGPLDKAKKIAALIQEICR